MNKPNARELLNELVSGFNPHISALQLASRVERVLIYCNEEQGHEMRRSLARMILRILNGEE
jgi:hypothetical protein